MIMFYTNTVNKILPCFKSVFSFEILHFHLTVMVVHAEIQFERSYDFEIDSTS